MTKSASDLTCFVIMPFGEKKEIDGTVVDFDEVYTQIVKEAVESVGVTCLRADEIDRAGWIHPRMFAHVYSAEVSVVDITMLNPNVFYELGIRHALADHVTVLIRQAGTKIPFNLQGMSFIEYNQSSLTSAAAAKKRIAAYISNGLKKRASDSPVHDALNLRIAKQPRDIKTTDFIEFSLVDVPDRRIGVVTGDLQQVKGIDIWVNSENTNMQMARHFDRSVSSTIRYWGAKRDYAGQVVEDTIADELTALMGKNTNVPPGAVIPTSAGELAHSNGVKAIFHAAAVTGQPGTGYQPIGNIGACVVRALQLADSDKFEDDDPRSILFPIMGTGSAQGDLEVKAQELIGAAIGHLVRHPPCRIDRVYFLAFTEETREVCEQILGDRPEVSDLVARKRTA